MKNVYVAAAVIVKDKKIFVTQRGYGEFKDGWEFPGGKVEPGEEASHTAEREIKEELDADIKADSYITTVEHDYPTFHIRMDLFLCHLEGEKMELLEAEAAKWVSVEELDTVPFLPPDKKALPAIKQKLIR